MGAFAHLYIDDYPMSWTKNGVDPHVMTIFRETDRRSFTRKISDRNPITWGPPEEDEGDEEESSYEYICKVSQAKARLNIMGFTLEKTREDWEKSKEEFIETRLGRYIDSDAPDIQRFNDSNASTAKLLSESSFDNFLLAFTEIMQGKLQCGRRRERSNSSISPLTTYLLKGDELVEGFPTSDIRYFLRALLEACPDTANVQQEVIELVRAGYYDDDSFIVDSSIEELTEDYSIVSKIIILTEGSTDGNILEQTLKLLYPHLYDYYSFMDFSGSNAMGGAGQLATTVKAFAGSGIANRVVAIFDNDTAGHVAMNGLKKSSIPENIKIIQYPDIEIARSYPTLGPGGISFLDINGLACGIELYFGEDILKVDGQFVPVQWRGYDESVRQYQGEILHKRDLQQAIAKKIAECVSNPKLLSTQDWRGLQIVWESIFGAFQ